MIKRTITYTDYNDVERTEDFYFNLTEPELVEMEVEFDEGFEAHLQRIIEEQDKKALIKAFKDIILLTFGRKTEDGRGFIKDESATTEFTQTPAYSVLYLELATDYEKAAEFIVGIMPRALQADIQKEVDAMAPPAEPTTPDAPVLPPPPSV